MLASEFFIRYRMILRKNHKHPAGTDEGKEAAV
jgi:hypothetical protein